jgi:ribosomal protein S18 acetylase RimI-like enzyme
MDYRDATARDIDAIAGLHAESWRRNYRGAFSDSYLDGDVLTDRHEVWAARLTDRLPGQRTIVAVHDGKVVGFTHTIFDSDPDWGALLDNLHVAHGLKRRGVGRRLMGHSAQAVVERSPSTGLYLWVLEQNRAAQAFYDALGGRCVGRGLATEPGGGRPPRLRYAWTDPSTLTAQAEGLTRES